MGSKELPTSEVIHVKRAWARQLRSAEVLESLEDQERDGMEGGMML